MKFNIVLVIFILLHQTLSIVDTNQKECYDLSKKVQCPSSSQDYYGQDAQYDGLQQSYNNNNDGTISDYSSGLMWTKTPDTTKVSFQNAPSVASALRTGGYSDWRVPSVKELYSLMDFSGYTGTNSSNAKPYINTNYFDFYYGDTSVERYIDAQFVTTTKYVTKVNSKDECMFGVNFADGRIKCYPISTKTFYAYYVRGDSYYGKNDFEDNGDETVTDRATGLMWMKQDSEEGMIWNDALKYCENLEFANYKDWRVPNIKELQSILDYTRSPDTTSSAAIDPIFDITEIIDEGENRNWPFFWSSTTHYEIDAEKACYMAFGEALGWMTGKSSSSYTLQDVHGAGAQRSDPKDGDPDDYPHGHGPQGDVIRIYNYVRCVRGQATGFSTKTNYASFLAR